MPDQNKRVAVIEDLDALFKAIDDQIAGFEINARYAAADYAEHSKPEDREAYRKAKAGHATVTALRSQVSRSVRVLIPGEVDRLFNKTGGQ